MGDASATPLDVVVVGGGIAGLSAAWSLRDRRVMLLEAEDRVGGRLRSERRGRYWLNYGAHLFPAPGTVVGGMVRELGLQTLPVNGNMMGLAAEGKLLTRGPVESYPLRLPLSPRERLAFASAGVRIRRALVRYRALARARPNDTPADIRSRLLSYLDDRTFSAFLGELPGAVQPIFSCAAHRATAEPDELSAGCGVGLFALVWGGSGSLTARNLVGGSGELPAALSRELGERVQVGSRVTAVAYDGGPELLTEYHQGSTVRRLRSRHVLVAAQAPHAAPLVREVAPTAAAALDELAYGAFLSLAVETNEQGPMAWDGVYAMATPGRSFDLFANQAQALRGALREPGGSLLMFAGARHATELMESPDEYICEQFLSDLDRLFPGSRRVVADAQVQRWQLGNVFSRPGRGRLQSALEGPLGAHGNVHLAGDYFAGLGNIEAAATSGREAAERIRLALGAPVA